MSRPGRRTPRPSPTAPFVRPNPLCGPATRVFVKWSGQIRGTKMISAGTNGTFGDPNGTSAGTNGTFGDPNGISAGTKMIFGDPNGISAGTKIIFGDLNTSFGALGLATGTILALPHLLRNGLRRRPGLKAKSTQALSDVQSAW